MGKAIVFNGVAVATPIQTVNFVVPLVTGQDYVNQYSLLAAEVTEPQKANLATFIDTLITNSVWGKVANCFPMLGGLSGYKFDCKDLKNQKTWSLPPLSTTWDAIRNAPYIFPIGNDASVNIPVTGLANNNFCLILSTKQKVSGEKYLAEIKFTDNTVGANLINRFGGNTHPTWNTSPVASNLTDYVVQESNSFVLNYLNGAGSAKVKSRNSSVLNMGVANAITKTIASVNIGLHYAAAGAAPAGSANYGNTNMAVICNTGLTDNEINIITTAINTFNESVGRNTAW